MGAGNVGQPKLSNTHRPGIGFVPRLREAAPLGFRYFRPPISTRVEIVDSVPRRLWSRGVSGEVIQAAGPWRTSGDWWRTDSWDRDEWGLALSDGEVRKEYIALLIIDFSATSKLQCGLEVVRISMREARSRSCCA